MCIMTAFLQHEVGINFHKKIRVATLPIELYIQGEDRDVCYEIYKWLNTKGYIYDNSILLPFHVSPPPKENYPPALTYSLVLNDDGSDIDSSIIARAIPVKKEYCEGNKILLINGTVIEHTRKGVYCDPIDRHYYERLAIIESDHNGNKRKTVCNVGFIDVGFY